MGHLSWTVGLLPGASCGTATVGKNCATVFVADIMDLINRTSTIV